MHMGAQTEAQILGNTHYFDVRVAHVRISHDYLEVRKVNESRLSGWCVDNGGTQADKSAVATKIQFWYWYNIPGGLLGW